MRPLSLIAPISVALAASPVVTTAAAFSVPPATTGAAATSSASSPTMSKVEAAAVQRFQRYDKLCKTCPTLLQPRIATLEEMIMGLSVPDRDELLGNVARRIQEQLQKEKEQRAPHASNLDPQRRIRSAKDVYKFQTGVDANTRMDELEAHPAPPRPKESSTNESSNQDKLVGKMAKIRAKFETGKLELSRVQSLLEHTDMMLSSGSRSGNNDNSEATATTASSNTVDSEIYHATEELQAMSRTELKMQRLKYVAQKMKLEQKLAKYRVKLYGASLQLATTTAITVDGRLVVV